MEGFLMPQTATWVRAKTSQERNSFGSIGMRLGKRLARTMRHLTLSDPSIVIPFEGGSPQNSSIQPTSNTHLPSVIAPPLRIRAEGFPEQVYIQNESTSYI